MISELKVWAAEFTQLEQQKNKRNLKSEDSLRDLRNNIKKTNILVLEVPQKEEKDTEKLFENVTPKIFSSLGKETDIQIQKAQKTLNKINPKRPTPRHRKKEVERERESQWGEGSAGKEGRATHAKKRETEKGRREKQTGEGKRKKER